MGNPNRRAKVGAGSGLNGTSGTNPQASQSISGSTLAPSIPPVYSEQTPVEQMTQAQRRKLIRKGPSFAKAAILDQHTRQTLADEIPLAMLEKFSGLVKGDLSQDATKTEWHVENATKTGLSKVINHLDHVCRARNLPSLDIRHIPLAELLSIFRSAEAVQVPASIFRCIGPIRHYANHLHPGAFIDLWYGLSQLVDPSLADACRRHAGTYISSCNLDQILQLIEHAETLDFHDPRAALNFAVRNLASRDDFTADDLVKMHARAPSSPCTTVAIQTFCKRVWAKRLQNSPQIRSIADPALLLRVNKFFGHKRSLLPASPGQWRKSAQANRSQTQPDPASSATAREVPLSSVPRSERLAEVQRRARAGEELRLYKV